MKKQISPLILGTALCVSSLTSQAAELSAEITNLTRGIYFTPILVAAHDDSAGLFSAAEAASSELQTMAEGGDISGLASLLTTASADMVQNPAGGLLGPGASTTAMLSTDDSGDNNYLSVVAMMLPTNDGFIALNSVAIPSEAGTYVYQLNAYDAGTEANDEIRGSGTPGAAGFPTPGPVDAASGTGGSGVSAVTEGFVHIHRGSIGDTDATSGTSDVDASLHRWLNPVARLVLTVTE